MSKLRLPVALVFLAFLVFGASAMAAENPAKMSTDSDSTLGVSTTLSQSAVFAAFLSDVNGGADANTAISISNIVIAPPKISGISTPDLNDTQGPITGYFYGNDGSSYVYKTSDNPTVGSGLDEAGELGPGGTWAVFMSELLGTMGVENFIGFGWFVADFDAVAGTYTNFFTGISAGFGAQMVPTQGGIPVDTSKEH